MSFKTILIFTLFVYQVTCAPQDPPIDIIDNIVYSDVTDFDDTQQLVPRVPLPIHDAETGISNFIPRIMGGVPAELGEFRGMASLQTRDGKHFCGATLINARNALTSAYCITTEKGALLPLDSYQLMVDSLSVTNPSEQKQIGNPILVFVHPNYNSITMLNNIAIVRVAEEFVPTSTYNPIIRAAQTPQVGAECKVAGWGSTIENGTYSSDLQKINVKLLDTNICNGATSYNGSMLVGMMCAGYIDGGRDACQGDSGAGLMCSGLFAGLVSFGHGCGRPSFPSVYTDITIYSRWITETLFWNYGDQSAVPTPTTQKPSGATNIFVSTYLIVGMLFIMGIVLLV